MKRFAILLVILLLAALPVLAASAQEGEEITPFVEVYDQASIYGQVTVASVTSPTQGWIVIHADAGGIGPVIGFAPVSEGLNEDVIVQVNVDNATPVLYAMLHVDDNTVGEYEFGAVEGADAPVVIDGSPLAPAFNVQLVAVSDQPIAEDGTVAVDAVVATAPGWIVIHADNDGAPGAVLGYSPVQAGINVNVAVDLDGETTRVLYAMLHLDDNTVGEYEFGAVEGADAPVMVEDVMVTQPFTTGAYLNAGNQLVLPGDGMGMPEEVDFVADAVLSEGPGWLVIHADDNGAPGAVIGTAQVNGLQRNVGVVLNPADVTPVIWPMLHVDDNEVGVYEFGTVEGADAPVFVDDAVLTFPVYVAPNFFPALVNEPESVQDEAVNFASIQIDAPGWIVIHASVDGAPGPVIGFATLQPGENLNVGVAVDFSAAPENASLEEVFPMLHYDTGVAGEYEFGLVEDTDLPVVFNGEVVTRALPIVDAPTE